MLRCSLALLALALTGPLASSVCAAQLLAPQELFSGDIETLDEYGYSVAVDGEWIAVGAISDDRNSQVDRGSVSVFRRAGTNWNFFTKLVPASPVNVRRFGFSIDLEGDRMVVGTIGLNGPGPLTGGVYVYEFDGSSWLQGELVRSTNREQARSGSAVSLSGDTLLDGAPFDQLASGPGAIGVVYVNVFDGADWVLQASLTANDASSGAEFGSSVALLGDLCAVGAPGANASYVFRRSGGIWNQEAKLVAPASSTGDLFGSAIALDDSNVAVGAPFEGGTLADSGGVYVFTRTGLTWLLDERVTPEDPLLGQQFGASLAMSGGRLYVGARNDSGTFGNAGSVFRFDDEFSGWTERTRFESDDLGGGDILGWSVDADSETLVSGARFDDSSAPDGGSAYAWADGCSVFTQLAQARYEVCLDLQLTDVSASVSVPKFDPVLGSLSGVRFDLRSHFEASTSYENLSATPATIDFSLDREMSVRRPGGTVILSEQNTAQEQVDLLAFDGVLDFLGGSSAELTNLDSDVVISETLLGSDLDLFTGELGAPELITLSIDATALVTKSLPANVARSAVTSLASAEITVEYLFEPTGTTFCFGDGADSMGCTPCPCGNDALPGTVGGCLNSAGESAFLRPAGTPSVSNDSLNFTVSRGTPGVFALLISGTAALPADGSCTAESGIQSDILVGLRCVGAGILRHGPRGFDDQGSTVAPWGAPDQSLVQQSSFVAGQTRYFQVLYRETSGVVCTIDQLLNSTNGVSVTFVP